MMNVPPSEAAELDIYTYEAMLWHWNEAHRSPDDVEAPDADTAMIVLDRINADPRLTH